MVRKIEKKIQNVPEAAFFLRNNARDRILWETRENMEFRKSHVQNMQKEGAISKGSIAKCNAEVYN